jgi:hypothetical protein
MSIRKSMFPTAAHLPQRNSARAQAILPEIEQATEARPELLEGLQLRGKEIFVRTDRRCTARTIKGKRCQMDVVARGETLCRCHHPDHAAAFHAKNREATKRYWKRRRAAEAMAKESNKTSI